MRFLADEHISRRVIEALRSDGHDVRAAAEDFAGFEDTDVAAAACSEERIIITEDTDFGELAVRLGIEMPGVLLIELPGYTSARMAARVREVVTTNADRFTGALVVVEPARVRIRKLHEMKR